MIDLDEDLRRAGRLSASWNEELAARCAEGVAARLGVEVEYEPPDEEWAVVHGRGATFGMVSARIPLALVTAITVPIVREVGSTVVTVTITDFLAEDLRASAELLRATILPHGWDPDFDTDAFCANDLFVESV